MSQYNKTLYRDIFLATRLTPEQVTNVPHRYSFFKYKLWNEVREMLAATVKWFAEAKKRDPALERSTASPPAFVLASYEAHAMLNIFCVDYRDLNQLTFR